jgi:hypothetical protein
MGFKVRYRSAVRGIGRFLDECGSERDDGLFVKFGGTVYSTREESQAVIDSHMSEFEESFRQAAQRVQLTEEAIALIVDHWRRQYSIVKSYRSATKHRGFWQEIEAGGSFVPPSRG